MDFYKPHPDDDYWHPEREDTNANGEVIQPVNLNAITHYARLGMKPKRICVLVGTSHTTIWNNAKMRLAYERGAAENELKLRSIVALGAERDPWLAAKALNRAAGTEEVDATNGEDPATISAPEVRIKIEVEDGSNRPEIQELKELLERKIAEQDAKK